MTMPAVNEKYLNEYMENVLYDMQCLRFDFFNQDLDNKIDIVFKKSLLESFYRSAKRIEGISFDLLQHYNKIEENCL